MDEANGLAVLGAGTLSDVTDAATPLSTGELENPSLVDLAVARLREEILSGGTEPGERLIEEQLTRRFGISRAPLREALRLLAQQGLVDHFPRRGARVAVLSDEDVRELYGIRDVLERHAIELAVPVLDPAALAGLRAHLELLRKADESDDRLRAAEAHRGFHIALVALAGNRQLSMIYESVIVKLQLYMAINLRREVEVGHTHHGVVRHERLLSAVESGDAARVAVELAEHGARSYLPS